MSPSIWQILIVIVLIVLLFGRNKISDLMGDVARGIRSFKKGLSDEPESHEPPKAVSAQKSGTASESKSEEKTEA